MAGDAPPPKKPPGGTKDGKQRQEDTIVKERVKKPPRYKVLLHNDDFTPMEFVVELLVKVFRRSRAESTRIMLTVHNEGAGVAGVYPHEIAESKSQTANVVAREAGFPLLTTTEPE